MRHRFFFVHPWASLPQEVPHARIFRHRPRRIFRPVAALAGSGAFDAVEIVGAAWVGCWDELLLQYGCVTENLGKTPKPNGFADHYPVF